MEELPNVTLEKVGAKSVPIASTGGDKTMFMVFLASRMVVDGQGNIVHVTKEPPLLLFKGAPDGKISKEIATAAEQSPHACDALTTDNGWMNGPTFLGWCKKRLAFVKKGILIVDLLQLTVIQKYWLG